jgi:hypothetical protein
LRTLPAFQSGALFLLEFWSLMPILGAKPYAAIAQSRTDVLTAFVRTGTFLTAFGSSM